MSSRVPVHKADMIRQLGADVILAVVALHVAR